jgi:hypothetical protein
MTISFASPACPFHLTIGDDGLVADLVPDAPPRMPSFSVTMASVISRAQSDARFVAPEGPAVCHPSASTGYSPGFFSDAAIVRTTQPGG